MEVNTRYLEEYGIVSGSRKQKYISDLSRLIVNSRASHSDKNRIMDGIGILPTDKIKILLAIITKRDEQEKKFNDKIVKNVLKEIVVGRET
jgi:hypothetical protein